MAAYFTDRVHEGTGWEWWIVPYRQIDFTITWGKVSSYFQCRLNVLHQSILVDMYESFLVCLHGSILIYLHAGGVISQRLHDQGTLFCVQHERSVDVIRIPVFDGVRQR